MTRFDKRWLARGTLEGIVVSWLLGNSVACAQPPSTSEAFDWPSQATARDNDPEQRGQLDRELRLHQAHHAVDRKQAKQAVESLQPLWAYLDQGRDRAKVNQAVELLIKAMDLIDDPREAYNLLDQR